MQDPADTVTADLPLERKRGRPATGKAMTAAERKRAQRARQDEKVSDALNKKDGLKELSTALLLDELGHCIAGRYAYTAQSILDELQSRVGAISRPSR